MAKPIEKKYFSKYTAGAQKDPPSLTSDWVKVH